MQSYAHQKGNTDLDKTFMYHNPNPDQLARFGKLRAAAKYFAQAIQDAVPTGDDREEALHHVRLSVMLANAGIAIGEAGDTFKQQTSNHPEQYGPNAVTETRLTGQSGSGGTSEAVADVDANQSEADSDAVAVDQERPRGRAKAGVL
jgi:hypothetical protein